MRIASHIVLLLIFATSLALTTQDPATQTSAPKTGSYRTFFTERSPLSDPTELGKRLAIQEPVGNYKIADYEFVVHVPENYDPTKPYGLLVLSNYKDSEQPPVTSLPLLSERRMIYVMSRRTSDPADVMCGLALDAVHNIERDYKIDRSRVYMFAFDIKFHAGSRVAFAYPDVFTGVFHQQPGYFKRIDIPPNQFMKASFPPPPQLAKAKLRAQIISSLGKSEYSKLVEEAFTKDGFRKIKVLEVDKRAGHYPDFQVEWVASALDFLDANAQAPDEPATQPSPSPQTAASRPVVNEARQTLNLARSYITAKKYADARTKLSALIQKFPGSPEAAEAKVLLKQIEGK